MTRLKFIGDMVEVNRIEISKRELSLLRTYGLFHRSIDDLYNQLIGSYNISGYSYKTNSTNPSFKLFVDDVYSDEFANRFTKLQTNFYKEKYSKRSNGDYFLIYIQQLENGTSHLDIDRRFDINKLNLKISEISQEDSSTVRVVTPTYDGKEPSMDISWTKKETFYLLKDNGAVQHINQQGQLNTFI